MNKTYRNSFCALVIDQHFPNAPYITFANFDAADEIRRCKEAYVDSLLIVTKCHWGYSYYPTKFGIMHPALIKRGLDMVGELVSQCRKESIESLAYYSVGFDNLAVRAHPEWTFTNRHGKRVTWAQLNDSAIGTYTNRWGLPCIINETYRQYCLDQISELFRKYKLDGIFLDIFGIFNNFSTSICYCPACLDIYAKHGLNPYDDNFESKFKLVKFKADKWADFMTEIKRTLHKAKPGASLTVNSSPFCNSSGVLKHVSWPYTEGGQTPYHLSIARGMGPESPQCGIPVACDAYDSWPTKLAEVMASTVVAYGCRTLFFFVQGRKGNGTFDSRSFDFLKNINKQTILKKKFVKNARALTAAAVYYSEASWIERGVHDSCWTHKDEMGVVIDSFRNVSVPCDFVLSSNLKKTDLNMYKLIVIADQKCMGPQETRIFKSYVKNGGNLLVTGQSGLMDNSGNSLPDFALSDVLGIRFDGLCTDYNRQRIGGYMRIGTHPFFSHLQNNDYAMWGNYIKVRATGASVIARIAEPIGIESNDEFIGWGPLPPAPKTSCPCITISKYGKGKAIYCAAPIGKYLCGDTNKFYEPVRWPAKLIHGIIEALEIHCGFKIDGPRGALEATFFKKGESVIVHLLNQNLRNANFDPMQISNSRILSLDFNLKAAKMVYPVIEYLTIQDNAVLIPTVDVHNIIEIIVQ